MVHLFTWKMLSSGQITKKILIIKYFSSPVFNAATDAFTEDYLLWDENGNQGCHLQRDTSQPWESICHSSISSMKSYRLVRSWFQVLYIRKCMASQFDYCRSVSTILIDNCKRPDNCNQQGKSDHSRCRSEWPPIVNQKQVANSDLATMKRKYNEKWLKTTLPESNLSQK